MLGLPPELSRQISGLDAGRTLDVPGYQIATLSGLGDAALWVKNTSFRVDALIVQRGNEVFVAQVGMRADADRGREGFSPGKSGGIMLRVAMLAVVVGVSWFAWSTGWAASHLGFTPPGRQSTAGRYMELSERPRLSLKAVPFRGKF